VKGGGGETSSTKTRRCTEGKAPLWVSKKGEKKKGKREGGGGGGKGEGEGKGGGGGGGGGKGKEKGG